MKIWLFTICSFAISAPIFSQDISLSLAEVHEDYQIFRTALFDAHPGLDLHLSEVELAGIFPEEYAFLPLREMDSEDIKLISFFKELSKRTARIQDRHTSLGIGHKFYEEFSALPHLPFELRWIDD